jgi:Leucine-rich repeat (LRR) protein
VADYHFAEGDAQESLLQLDAARRAYERALQLDPSNTVARANLDLCRRILATRHGASSAESMYALHGLMMDQKRLPEALQMAHRLATDRPLLHRTLSAILEEARLPAKLDLNGDGSFDLDLSGPGRPDLSVLSRIPLRSLKLARSDVVDLTPLKGLALKKLDLAETRVHDITPLQGMPLTTLDLSKTDVSNLFPLEKMPLRELLLDDTPVSDISVLQGMPLQSLHLAATRIRNLAALAGSPLRTLDLSGTKVADLSPLRHLPIERLQLNNTGVVDLAPLAGAPLAFLSLTGTDVDDLHPLQKLPLKELALGRCENLRDVRALAACVSLERLTIPRQVTDIESLRKLPSLRFLSYEQANTFAASEQSAAEFWAARKMK